MRRGDVAARVAGGDDRGQHRRADKEDEDTCAHDQLGVAEEPPNATWLTWLRLRLSLRRYERDLTATGGFDLEALLIKLIHP